MAEGDNKKFLHVQLDLLDDIVRKNFKINYSIWPEQPTSKVPVFYKQLGPI
ncbi:MAG: hypothetical protein WD037_02560 [Balneolales bacterium]